MSEKFIGLTTSEEMEPVIITDDQILDVAILLEELLSYGYTVSRVRFGQSLYKAYGYPREICGQLTVAAFKLYEEMHN